MTATHVRPLSRARTMRLRGRGFGVLLGRRHPAQHPTGPVVEPRCHLVEAARVDAQSSETSSMPHPSTETFDHERAPAARPAVRAKDGSHAGCVLLALTADEFGLTVGR